LLVPAASAAGDTAPPPLAAPIDQYECYRVKGARTRVGGVTLKTKFGPDTVVDVKRPSHLCKPVAETGAGLVDPSRNLICYQVRTKPQSAVTASTTDRFQSDTFKLFGLRELCVPTR
jgi:hypothetical protein